MRVGVPSEIKVHEYRVGLTPGAVREYVAHGHQLVVQSGAGAGIMASDDAYRAAGAEIAATAAEIFANCDMIVKVKEPQPSEWVLLRPGQLLFTYLHLAPDPEQAKGLIASGCTAIAYETVTDDKGTLPLLAPLPFSAEALLAPTPRVWPLALERKSPSSTAQSRAFASWMSCSTDGCVPAIPHWKPLTMKSASPTP
jgi:alanine dehydrogenase